MSDGSPESSRTERLPLLPLLAAMWLLTAIVENALLMRVPGTVIHDESVPEVLAIGLAGYDLLVLAVVVVVVGLPIGLLLKLVNRFGPARRFVMGLLFPGVFVLVLAWGLDWAALATRGSYLTSAIVSGWMNQPVEGATPSAWDLRVTIGVPVAALVLTGLIVAGLPRFVTATKWRRALMILAAVLLGLCGGAWGAAEATIKPDQRSTYQTQRATEAGVFAHVAEALRGAWVSR
jgi:hypothetical protein